MRKTFITQMPDKPGSFLQAVNAVSGVGLNITRVSYNKAVDANMLFIEVSGDAQTIARATQQLEKIGYLSENNETAKVILLEFKLLDVSGSLKPVLETINRYSFNISYISSQQNNTDYQYFKMGLFIEDAQSIKDFLDAVSKQCAVRIIEYDSTEKTLDNTVFYISFANEIAHKLQLSREETNSLIENSNLVMQILDEQNKSPFTTFDYIAKFADCLAENKASYSPRVTRVPLSCGSMYCVEPPCGSNTYVLQTPLGLIFIDSGFALYRDNLLAVLREQIDGFDDKKKVLVLTHPDIDHCGVSDVFDEIYVSQSAYRNFELENEGQDNVREKNAYHAPYVRISKILSGYKPLPLSKLKVIAQSKGESEVAYIGELSLLGLKFDVYEGNGGHTDGELAFVNKAEKLLFSGDVYLNVEGYTAQQAEFNRLAPYLMTGVNTDSARAKAERLALAGIAGEGYLLCGGHGAIKKL